MSILKTENLKMSIDKEVVLDELSFEIDEKGIYVILSKSALETTTLARVLAGILTPDEGSVSYKDIDLSDKKNGKALKSKIGYLPKESFLYPDMTAYEVLEFTGKMRKVPADKRFKQIKEALELVGFYQMSDVLVKDMTFSQKKRLLLANALIGNPSVLIFDEPTAKVISEDAELIRDVILMLGERKTLIILTEKIALADKLGKNIGIMSKGKMVLWSSLENIKQKLDNDSNALLKTFLAFTDESAGGAI